MDVACRNVESMVDIITHILVGKSERDYLLDLGIDVRIILKLLL
jgi:hypothetical protein